MTQSAPTARLRLEDQVAVVTGGSRGIGEGIVKRFVEEGAKVVFSDLLNEKGKALEEELGERVAFYRADATSPSETEALMKFAVERFGRLDCVVNNAGVGGEGGPIAGTSVEGFNKSIATVARRNFLRNQVCCPAYAYWRNHHQHRERGKFGRWVMVHTLIPPRNLVLLA
jgi:NAD(P)-dependent dehydrogenase (short-subunit alcohol dehydrogenase family)